MTEFNLPLLRKAVEWAESENRKPVNESEWEQNHFAVPGGVIGRTCDTAYCIAGWVAFQAGGHVIRSSGIDGNEFAKVAMDLLGIDMDDAWGDDGSDGLFDGSNTIEDVRMYAERIARRYGEEL